MSRGLKRYIKEIALLVIMLITAYYLLNAGLRAMLAVETPIMIVSSGSMVPTLNVNDAIIVQGVDVYSLKVGDIIVFQDPRREEKYYIVHRIIEVIPSTPPSFRTKGDANPYPDSYVVEAKYVIGKVVYVIPKVGLVLNLIRPPFNYLLVILLLLLYSLYRFKSSPRE